MAVQFDNLGDLKPKVTAGGKDKTKFVPNLNVSFHDDEFYFNLNRKDKVIKNEKAATASGKTSLSGIDTDIWYIDDKGRLKWDIEFASRPKINSWTWELKHAKGIEFYYQGELTAEEIADGCVRPDEVVGSYAVYCNKANNKYKTGKLCHIYRPFCYDAKGKTIYADLNIADGQLTISINAAWLDSAVYPVRLDPTFGYETQGASYTSFYYEYSPRCSVYGTHTASSGDKITQYSIYAHTSSGGSSVDIAAYSIVSGDPSTRIAEAQSVFIGTTPEWKNTSVVEQVLSNGVVYGIGFGNFPVVTEQIYYDTGTNYVKRHNEVGELPETWTNDDTQNYIYSVYATYTESGGGGNSYYYQQQQM